jgi:tRNA A-37 threonylcarbamoyl transferase component Bud32
MSQARGTTFEVARWRFLIPDERSDLSGYLRDELADEVVAALEGNRGAPFRRSRHATTWKVKIAGPGGEQTNIFVKQLDRARGLVARAKAISRAKRSAHVLRLSEELRRAGFGVPRVLLIGENRDPGNEVMVMSEAPGFMLTRWMNPAHHVDLKLRRRILHQLGTEIAGLHLAGYIHGDLTPYNIFAVGEYQIAISFIDHEGTQKISRVSINPARNRIRNLVQLGHFDIPGVSRSDKMRVFAGYRAAMSLAGPVQRRILRRLVKMIERRRSRDRALKHRAVQPAIIAEEGVARG